MNSSKLVEQLANHLRSHGYSLTKPRRVIFEYLLSADAQSMQDVAAALSKQLDRASLYRTIGLFEELGVVQRITIGWKYKVELTDAFSAHHHHLICVGCGKLEPFIGSQDIEHFLIELSQQNHFQAIKHTLEIEGYCRTCQEHFKPVSQPVPHPHHKHA